MFTNIAAVVAALAVFAGGLGYEVHNHSTEQSPTQHVTTTASNGTQLNQSRDTIYSFQDYKEHVNDKTIQFYEQGKIVNETIPYQKSLNDALAHSPWRTDPLQSAQVYTTNLLPHEFLSASWSEKSSTALSATIGDKTVAYTLVNKQTCSSPKTALVSLDIKGVNGSQKYNIYLFELGNRYVWNIYEIAK
ncbi:hypothetical protein [Alicyclobacillus suci]|uniref:hypothetical protein n=1 Tax=Alicyclobacillus suci TaxID=2816080 RepID=UPI001A8DB6C1|nr:hypothetical protein [Alicyclobacillus suci]